MVITRVGPLSAAKIAATLYAIMGLIIGAFFSLAALAGAFASGSDDTPFAMMPAIFGVGAVILLPILYGCMGFIGTLIAAWIYNGIAATVGGVELDVQ
jgi:hypothetical protein